MITMSPDRNVGAKTFSTSSGERVVRHESAEPTDRVVVRRLTDCRRPRYGDCCTLAAQGKAQPLLLVVTFYQRVSDLRRQSRYGLQKACSEEGTADEPKLA